MAEMFLRRHEVEDEDLPMVCARCGEEAVVHRSKTFTWHPGWMIILVILSLVIGVLIILATQKKMRAVLPFCHRHRNHFRWRAWFLGGVFAVLFAAFVTGTGLMLTDANNRNAGPLVAVSLLGLVLWVVLAVVVSRTAIRPTMMTETDITLAGLSTKFVRAVVDYRREERGDAPALGEETDYDRMLRERRHNRLKRQLEDD